MSHYRLKVIFGKWLTCDCSHCKCTAVKTQIWNWKKAWNWIRATEKFHLNRFGFAGALTLFTKMPFGSSFEHRRKEKPAVRAAAVRAAAISAAAKKPGTVVSMLQNAFIIYHFVCLCPLPVYCLVLVHWKTTIRGVCIENMASIAFYSNRVFVEWCSNCCSFGGSSFLSVYDKPFSRTAKHTI